MRKQCQKMTFTFYKEFTAQLQRIDGNHQFRLNGNFCFLWPRMAFPLQSTCFCSLYVMTRKMLQITVG